MELTKSFGQYRNGSSVDVHFLYAAYESRTYPHLRRNCPEIRYPAQIKILRQRQLRERPGRYDFHWNLIIHFQDCQSPGPGHPHFVPLAQSDLVPAYGYRRSRSQVVREFQPTPVQIQRHEIPHAVAPVAVVDDQAVPGRRLECHLEIEPSERSVPQARVSQVARSVEGGHFQVDPYLAEIAREAQGT